MLAVVPDYYSQFRCIAGRCRHSCCIGWEIDVDAERLEYYRSVPGAFGERLRANIAQEEPPHFVLQEGERCPFLNSENLCDIILTLGEEQLCEICAEHPRFHNRLPGRVESGLGLCCEEAARLILGRAEPMALLGVPAGEAEDDLLALRDRALSLLQDRSRPLSQRMEAVLALCGAALPERTVEEWCDLLLSLERLDDAWTERLQLLRENWKAADTAGFALQMADRGTEYEQFAVYLLYRYLSQAVTPADLAARAAFAAWGSFWLYALGAVLWTKTGQFTFADQVELARLFSSELEYSEENIEILLDELC